MLLISPLTLHAEIHKCTKNGNVIYSDKPCAKPKTNHHKKPQNKKEYTAPSPSSKKKEQIVPENTYIIGQSENLLKEMNGGGDTQISINTVKYLIKKGANINYKGKNGDTPFIEALRWKRAGSARIMLDHNPDLNISNIYGQNPFYYAAQNGNNEIIEIMLSRGLPVDYQPKDQLGYKFHTPLVGAVTYDNADTVTLLLSRGANPNKMGPYDKDSACTVAKERNKEKIITLLSKKCNMDKILSRSERICQQLEKKVKTKGAGNSKLNTLQKLIPKESKSWKPLKDTMIKYQSSDLMDASTRCDVSLVKWIVQHGEDLNQVFSNGKTPLLSAVMGENKPVIEYLIKAGANINYKNRFGHTPLSVAIKGDQDEVILLLLDLKADPNVTGRADTPPLVLASNKSSFKSSRHSDAYDSDAVVKALLDKGANPNAKSMQNGQIFRTPLFVACGRKGNYAKVKMLIDAGADPNLATRGGKVPLSYASSLSSVEMVSLLAQSGADVNHKDKRGRPVVFRAASRPEKLSIFLKHGLDIEISDNEGISLLMMAVTSLESVKLLLAKGANPDRKTKSGETALMKLQKIRLRYQGKEKAEKKIKVLDKIEELLLEASKQKRSGT